MPKTLICEAKVLLSKLELTLEYVFNMGYGLVTTIKISCAEEILLTM